MLVFFIGVYSNVLGFTRSIIAYMAIIMVVLVYLWNWFPTQVLPIIITNFVLTALMQWDFLVVTQLCAHFPETGTTGMLYTMNASFTNFGKNMSLHTALLKKFPWKTLSMFGMIIQIPLIIFFVPKMI